MSAENSVARGGREPGAQAEPAGLELPPEVQSRYNIRLVETPGAEPRFGLFAPGNRETPAIEITGDRIVARREDAETVDSLVKIAKHNDWDRIDVDGSPEFRKAVWTAASREGLAVSGYEPSFVEREQAANARREDVARRDQGTMADAPARPRFDPDATIPARSAQTVLAERERPATADKALSDADSRLLLKVSALTEDRKGLQEGLRRDMDVFTREIQYERIDDNRGALNGALDRALESPTVVKAFERAGYEPDALRQLGRGGEWDTDVADAIYMIRSGSHRDTLGREAGERPILADEIRSDREDRAVAESTAPDARRANGEPSLVREEQQQAAAERRHEGDELAELFLHGASETVARDPRLAGAREVQAVMEQHIGEVYRGDATQVASANLESRQMISDALRRGLDVSVREPTPVRQIEPIQARPDLER
ncbi:LPD7 domain-containing protein [Sphingomonas bacterium]|uniref:LPD7 domain-containing protein n=1 Tax=Sphingomonas bacterium TaxID=1895847 RepID=UPI001575EAD7|nr:LPD7 domain-containing protein [Sphingomonas bacterium]